jgi:hypothetical protein
LYFGLKYKAEKKCKRATNSTKKQKYKLKRQPIKIAVKIRVQDLCHAHPKDGIYLFF